MGQAKLRGTFEERRDAAIAARKGRKAKQASRPVSRIGKAAAIALAASALVTGAYALNGWKP